MAERETYQRFSISQRVQHWVMFVSFTVLATTGLPQRYAQTAWADTLISLLGGIETVRIVHRGAAVVFILVTLFHFVHLAYKVFVDHARPTILPGFKDVTDLIGTVRYNLHLMGRPPQLPRFSFGEKIEYWSLIWGSILMIATGCLLWNPVLATRFLPGEFIPAAKMAHSAEALLAVLAVIIWHFYAVHLKHFNRSIFTGRLTREEMEEEHAAELEEIEAGVIRFPQPVEAVRRRERVFLPIALVVTLVLVIGLYWFLTAEHTAITTVPPAETMQAYVPATPTPTNTPTVTPTPTQTLTPALTPTGAVSGPSPETTPVSAETLLSLMVIPHPLQGREDCLMCHGEGKPNPFPADHVGRPSTTCLVCHGTSTAEEHLPALVKHDLEGRENCLMCHAVDLLPLSHKTAAFSNNDCLLCHVPMGRGGPVTPPGTPAATTLAAPIPHPLEGREDCLLCHGAGGVKPYPADHTGRTSASCLACHKSQ
jgi:formate dehydrogenase gamma subunit